MGAVLSLRVMSKKRLVSLIALSLFAIFLVKGIVSGFYRSALVTGDDSAVGATIWVLDKCIAKMVSLSTGGSAALEDCDGSGGSDLSIPNTAKAISIKKDDLVIELAVPQDRVELYGHFSFAKNSFWLN